MVRVSRLSIAPVRALGLQHPQSIDIDAAGVREDRRFFLIDEHGHIVDRLRAGGLVRVQARTNPDATWLRLTFPDGTVVGGDVQLDEPVRIHVYGREAVGHVVGGPWAAALEPYAHGRPLLLVRCDNPGGTRIRPGETQVRNAVSIVSDGSLAELARRLGVERVDGRRFRMLIELEGAAQAHEEDTWIGGQVAIGSAVLEITKPDARCAITTQDPDTGERDLDTLRTILNYRGFRANDDEKRIDFGVLGEVAVPGRISVGDEVHVLAYESLAGADKGKVGAGADGASRAASGAGAEVAATVAEVRAGADGASRAASGAGAEVGATAAEVDAGADGASRAASGAGAEVGATAAEVGAGSEMAAST